MVRKEMNIEKRMVMSSTSIILPVQMVVDATAFFFETCFF